MAIVSGERRSVNAPSGHCKANPFLLECEFTTKRTKDTKICKIRGLWVPAAMHSNKCVVTKTSNQLFSFVFFVTLVLGSWFSAERGLYV
ncbi:MAG TPA: hypothetical protein DDY14_10345 [Chromatiaceae bacterium]|nr:hypothetical protein [Chromatiaceae bacterium]